MPLVATWTGKEVIPYMFPEEAKRIVIKLANSVTIVAGTVIGRNATGDVWDTYANAGALDPAKAILGITTTVDGSGNHFYGSQASGEMDESHLHTFAFVSGTFLVSDLTGLDAGAVTDLKATLIAGDDVADPNAVVRIP